MTQENPIARSDGGPPLEIVPFDAVHAQAFRDLNLDWIEKHFAVEALDRRHLHYPRESFIDTGGAILMAQIAGNTVGCCGLLKHDEDVYEVSKMAVAPPYQGKGIGRVLDSLVQLYGMAMVVLPVIAFVSLRKRIRYEGMSRRGALARYAAQVVMPILAYGGLFALALGVEAVAPVSLVEKGVRESFALAIVLGALVWLLSITIFALGLMFVPAG